MQEIYYYGKDRVTNTPIITVCLIINNGLQSGKVEARGVAMLSEQDQFNRKLGRKIALGQALKAYNSFFSRHKQIKSPQALKILQRAGLSLTEKSSSEPILLENERELLAKIFRQKMEVSQ